jgi:hypothetical protein
MLSDTDNDFMSTVEKTPGVDVEPEADNELAARLYSEGQPFPPDLVRRIQERAARIRAEIVQTVGYIDFVEFIHQSRDER